jgi:hypothetical protein
VQPRYRWVVGLAAALLTLVGSPAAADPPAPTNYRSDILAIYPPLDGVRVEVLGGDAFLLLEAPGRQILVPGYDGEELYLRYEPDGSVYENRRSVTWFQNQDRYGSNPSAIPADVGADAAPQWELVATGGRYAWHDHRIHWMSPTTLPGQVDPTRGVEQVAYEWPEPITIEVDGAPVAIAGQLSWVPDASPLPGWLLALVALVGVVALGWRRAPLAILAAVGLGAAVALVVSVPDVVGLDPGVTALPLRVVLPAIALLVALAGWSVRERSTFGLVVAGAGGVPLALWSLGRLDALTAPIVPPDVLPAGLVRLAIGAVLGLGVGAAVTGVRALLAAGPADLDLD